MYSLRLLFLAVCLMKATVSEDIVAYLNSRNGPSHEDRVKRQVLIYSQVDQERHKWPNHTVNYYFDKYEFDVSMTEAVLRAMELISNHTCIKFSTEPADISLRILSEHVDYCYAAIGHVLNNTKDQTLMFNSACYTTGLAAHELIHSLGFIHSHQRSDRNQYLDFKKNMEDLTRLERQQYDMFKVQKLIVPYDYGSVMHYASRHGDYAPIHKNRWMSYAMGSQIIAYYDYLMINKYYECSCEENTQMKCQNDGYPNPSNCSQCNCPIGFGGDDCSQRPEPGATLEATKEWQNITITLDAGYRKETEGKINQIDYIYHYLWITAPANKTTEVRVNRFKEEKCIESCGKGGVEIKTNPDPKLTSPRFCCDQPATQRSRHTPTIVMAFNSEGADEYTFSYRYV